jgi:hypothetical protein
MARRTRLWRTSRRSGGTSAGQVPWQDSNLQTCCLGDDCRSSAPDGSVRPGQVRLAGVSVEHDLVRCRRAWGNDRGNDRVAIGQSSGISLLSGGDHARFIVNRVVSFDVHRLVELAASRRWTSSALPVPRSNRCMATASAGTMTVVWPHSTKTATLSPRPRYRRWGDRSAMGSRCSSPSQVTLARAARTSTKGTRRLMPLTVSPCRTWSTSFSIARSKRPKRKITSPAISSEAMASEMGVITSGRSRCCSDRLRPPCLGWPRDGAWRLGRGPRRWPRR